MAEFASEALFGAYRLLGRAALPFMPLALSIRAARGKEDRSRAGERLGRPSRPRPPGRLVWVHAASVGETNAILPLIARVAAGGSAVLLTTVTVTAASVAAAALPPGAVHQYAPVDVGPVIDRFLSHWRPDLALFVESEQWPTTIARLHRAGIPRVIVNARMSERSYRRWQRLGGLASAVFSRTTLCLAQTTRDAERYAALGAGEVRHVGNLKFDAPPPEAQARVLAALRATTGNRPIWLAASTHEGEEAVVVAAHRRLRERFPGLLTVIVPRHPQRGPALARMLAEEGLPVARRSAGEPVVAGTEIYLADTLGELGAFFRIAPIAFLGGSLASRGGQNPIEPARLGVVVLHGPNVYNFAEVYEALDRSGDARRVLDAAGLAEAAAALLAGPLDRQERARSAAAALERFGGALERTVDALAPWLARNEAKVPVA